MNKAIHKLSKSISYWEKCRELIPSGSSTLAKSPSRLAYGYSPFYAKRAEGSSFWDVDGNKWLDCEMSMGTVVWGHCREEIDAAMIAQIKQGLHFSVPSILEYNLAERLLARFPIYKAAKFFTNGADAVYACVRAARYLSGRSMTLSCEYHGWLDWSSPTYYRCPPSVLGIPDEILSCHISCYGGVPDIMEQIEKKKERLAAVVLCPASYKRDELVQILELCKKHEIYTVFDEVTSGCRFARGGATMAFSLRPDYLCISKGLTNGLPLAVALGRKEHILVMEQLKISNAHAGSNLALAAALACEELLSQSEVWPSWKPHTEKIMTDINNILKKIYPHGDLILSGSAGCFSIVTPQYEFLKDPFRKYMMTYLSKYNIFSKGYILFSDAHTESEMSFTAECLINCIQEYAALNS